MTAVTSAVAGLAALPLAPSGGFPAPKLEYGELAPMLILFTAACVGILVEAFAPRTLRLPIQLVLSFGSLIAAFVAVVMLHGHRGLAAEGAVAVDGPALFLQGTILVLAFGGVLMMAERSLDPQGDAFAPSASVLPGSEQERAFVSAGVVQGEVFPLTLFAVAGMLLFASANDLLT